MSPYVTSTLRTLGEVDREASRSPVRLPLTYHGGCIYSVLTVGPRSPPSTGTHGQ